MDGEATAAGSEHPGQTSRAEPLQDVTVGRSSAAHLAWKTRGTLTCAHAQQVPPMTFLLAQLWGVSEGVLSSFPCSGEVVREAQRIPPPLSHALVPSLQRAGKLV